MLDRSEGEPFVKAGSLQLSTLAEFAKEKVAEFDVRPPSIDAKVGQLPGGNQPQVVLARELSRELRLLVAAQPTRGADVGSNQFIHKRNIKTRNPGAPGAAGTTKID